jgi:sugar transferase (PEP-CTERM/EpsH1 system associated)
MFGKKPSLLPATYRPRPALKMTGSPLVLHVIHQLAVGGMENGLINLINGMSSSRFRHAIACVEDYSDFCKRLEVCNTEIFALNRSVIGVWAMRREMFNLCRRLRPAIVHSRNMSGLDAVFPARLAGVRGYIHSEHGWDVDDLQGKNWKSAILRRAHSPFVDRYLTVSKHLKQYLINQVGIADSRITQICNGVDTQRFRPDTNRAVEVLPPDFADTKSIIIGTVGRIQEVKDHETLIRAFAALVRNQTSVAARARLVIAGDGPLLPRLRQVVESLDLWRVVWFPGATSNVPETMRAFDIFVLPSLMEGISNTILEAMATGLPIIATAVGGNVELVDEGCTGHLFQPRDIDALTKLLTDYATDPSVRQQHGCRAREVAIEKFSLNTMVANYQTVYEELYERNSRKGFGVSFD